MKTNCHQNPRSKCLTSLTGFLAAACVLLCDGKALAQSSINGASPNGAYLFQPSPALTFTANSLAGITNVTVELTATSLHTGQSILKTLTAANGLTITGPTTSLIVSAVLKSNMLYSAAIQIKDANGSVANQTVSFDTIRAAYTWEAEDWDYTSGGVSGLFVDNPQTNLYAGLLTTDGVDAHNGNGPSPYRPGGDTGGGGLATENCGDQSRVSYLGNSKTDYDVGWTDGGDFANFTRHYPAGTYNLFARVGGGSGVRTECADISVVAGSAVISSAGSGPYKFGVKGRGWQNYDFMPVTDNAGNLIKITFDGNPSTLQVLQNQGADNMNFFMLVPLQPVEVSTVTIANAFPDGTYQFQATNKFTFEASSPVAINPATDVSVQLTGTNLLGQGSVVSLTPANGLTVTGTSTSIVVSAPLASNTVYTAFIQVSDANGVPASCTVKFDTVTPAYTFEAEDFNYNGGSFFDNPQINGYANQDGVAEIDFHRNNSGGNASYNRLGLPGENASDVPRLANVGFPDYDLGNTAGGNWANYTRTYPAGIYNILVRVSRGDGGIQTDAGRVSVVTSDITQPDQTVQLLGKHNTPSTGNWQNYVWMPIINSGGVAARFVADGTVKTLRYTFDGAGENVGFLMLIPADLSVNPPPFVSDFTPDGTSLFQYTNKISFLVNSSVGITTNNVLLNVDGGNVSGLSFSGSSTAWHVTFPVSVNGFHTAIIRLTDSAGTTYYTNIFDTFSPDTYSFEAEDYDYTGDGINGGLFIDNPQVNAYSGLGSIALVDEKDDNHGGSGYRPFPPGLEFETAGDLARSQYTGGITDYNIGFNNGGNWANYTRTYPTGTYNIWIRSASPSGNADAASVSVVTNGWGTTIQGTARLGIFAVPNTGDWHKFTWAPLVDANGNYVKFTSNGSTNTLKVSVDGGSYNVNFYALVPEDTSRPTLTGLYPNGLTQFQATNTLSFNAISSQGIATNSIVVTLNGVLVTNLIIIGSSTNWHVSAPYLQANNYYSIAISFTTLLGGSYVTSFNFDTYSPANYQWECEDWDYTSNSISGQFFDNPQVNAYANATSAEGIDVSQINPSTTGNPFAYRGYDGLNLTPAQEPSGDMVRSQFGATHIDYKLDWFGYGSWCNYTRHYPAGTYNIIGRFTEGSAATVATLSKVTSGHGTAGQTTAQLGIFYIPLTSWSSSTSVYLRDGSSNLVSVTFDGSQTTLRLSGNPVALNDPTINANYLMLVPASPVPPSIILTVGLSGGNIRISFPTQIGAKYQLLYKNSLTDANWMPLGSPISGSGGVCSASDPASGNSRFYKVQVQ